MHDPRIGRFFAVDPLAPKYPWYTPYQFSGNKVISHVELEGLEEQALTPSGGSINLPSGANILKRYEAKVSESSGTALGVYPNYNGQTDVYSGVGGDYYAARGGVQSFEYSGTTYDAVFSSKTGLFMGYESTDNIYENGYTKSATPTISYGGGNVITSQGWGMTSGSGSQAMAAGGTMAASLGDTPLGWAVGAAGAISAYLASTVELDSRVWNFNLTDAQPIAMPVSTTTTYDEELFTIIYRNISENEYKQLASGGYNFAFGKSMHSMIVKQFWLDPSALAGWNASDMNKKYNVSILVPKSIIGPGNILDTSTPVDVHLGRSATITNQIDLNIFNKVKTILSITPSPLK